MQVPSMILHIKHLTLVTMQIIITQRHAVKDVKHTCYRKVDTIIDYRHEECDLPA